jgi:ATP-dependent Clp protease ATP-binding subunit ClpA
MVILSQHSSAMSNVLELSAIEATELHHECQEPGHLLLALVSRPGENPAGRVLQYYGVLYEFVLPVILAAYASSVGVRSVEKFSQASVDVINSAEGLARKGGRNLVPTRPHHLLIALINSNDVVVEEIFTVCGMDQKLALLLRLDYEVADSDYLD